MEGFSSPPRRVLLPFEAKGSKNLAKLDLKPRFTPMILCERRILGFELKKEKKKIREKEKNKEGKYVLFLLHFKKLIFSLQKRMVQKGRHLFKINRCQHWEETKFLTRNDS